MFIEKVSHAAAQRRNGATEAIALRRSAAA